MQASVRHSMDGWNRLASETDPLVLATLLGDWFRRLRVPSVTASVILPQSGGLLESQDRMSAVNIYFCQIVAYYRAQGEPVRPVLLHHSIEIDTTMFCVILASLQKSIPMFCLSYRSFQVQLVIPD